MITSFYRHHTRDAMYSLGIGFTAKCNMNCAFCYSKKKRNEKGELPLSLWTDFITRNADMIDAVNYGTGENSLSNEWFELIHYIRRQAPLIRQALTTNGSLALITETEQEKMKIFEECIDEVDVSIDYGDEVSHNLGRGCDSAFKWAIETLDLCKRVRKQATIVMVGTESTLTAENLQKIFEIAREKDAVVRINLYRPVNPLSPMQPPRLSNIDKAFKWIAANGRFLAVSDPLISSIYFDSYARRDPSGSTSFRIVQNGDIFPSTYLLNPELCIGNIKDINLSDMNGLAIVQRFSSSPVPDACIGCEWYNTCGGGTLDRRYLVYGTLEERDPYCPYRQENVGMFERHKIDAPKPGYQSVHDGYLPTIIVEARR